MSVSRLWSNYKACICGSELEEINPTYTLFPHFCLSSVTCKLHAEIEIFYICIQRALPGLSAVSG